MIDVTPEVQKHIPNMSSLKLLVAESIYVKLEGLFENGVAGVLAFMAGMMLSDIDRQEYVEEFGREALDRAIEHRRYCAEMLLEATNKIRESEEAAKKDYDLNLIKNQKGKN